MGLAFSIIYIALFFAIYFVRWLIEYDERCPGMALFSVMCVVMMVGPMFAVAYLVEYADLSFAVDIALYIAMSIYYISLFLFSRGFRPGRFRKKYITGPLKMTYLSIKIRPFEAKARKIADDAELPISEIDAMANELIRTKGIDSFYAYREAKSQWRQNLYYKTMESYGVSIDDVKALERLECDLANYSVMRDDSMDRVIKHEIAKEIVDQLKPTPSELAEIKKFYNISDTEAINDPEKLRTLWRTWKCHDMIDSQGIEEEFKRRLREEEKV